jgi:hypothetical protein
MSIASGVLLLMPYLTSILFLLAGLLLAGFLFRDLLFSRLWLGFLFVCERNWFSKLCRPNPLILTTPRPITMDPLTAASEKYF